MIRVVCPNCEKKLGIDDQFAGRLAVCPRCKTKVQVPRSEIPLKEEEEPAKEAREPSDPQQIEEHEPVNEIVAENHPRPKKKKKRRPKGEDNEAQADEKPAQDEQPARKPPAGEEEDEGEGQDGEEIEVPEDWKPPAVMVEKGPIDAFLALDLLWQLLLGVGVFCLILSMFTVSLKAPPIANVVLVIGAPIFVVGTGWYLLLVFNESILQGLFCLFVPLYFIYYFLTHTDEVQRPFYIGATGVLITMMSYCAGAPLWHSMLSIIFPGR
jgi:hypothetical protein